ncbi:hypothetical protein DH2020_031148 [Rehmannia glutinosa]|uniref:Uncharacterized protein n=1 Tax=Rehmannia glutinosa TaxID=99300 RepID=A0ABR0VMS4_REHGL
MGTLKSETCSIKSEMGNLKISVDSFTKQEPTSSSDVSSLCEKTHSTITPVASLNTLIPTNLSIPNLKYEENGEIEIQSPDYSLWDSLISDADFMICSPVRNMLSSSPQASNYNNYFNYGQTMHGQSLVGSSPPRFPSPLGTHKGKGMSPLHRVFNSPNNQFLQVEQVESLSMPALESLLDDYDKDDNFMVFSPMKLPGGGGGGGGGEGSNDCYDALSMVPELLDCLAMPNNSTRFCENSQEQDSGLQLVHLLLACAEAVSKEDYMLARRYIHHLNRVVLALGDSMQRVAACFTEALSARLAATLTNKPSTSNLKPFNPFPPDNLEILKIYQILYQACPYIKFAHFTANQAIFEAFEAEERVHVIDLDILQGYQWPAFMQALAARPGGAPFLRITGVGPSPESVRETGRCLTELAHSLHVPFEFHPVGEELEDLKPHMFNRRVGEALAVNSVNRLHRVPGNCLGNLLAMIRDQAPNIVTIVEQEASHNGPYFLGRFLEALHYYSAIFDSLDATFPPDSAQRAKVEQLIFLPEIRNIVAHEGPERVMRHERLEKWRKIMEGKGFQGVPLSSNAVTQSKILLGLYSCDGYRLTEDKGCLLLGWQDRSILAASAWRC